MPIVLDSWAVLALLQEEASASRIEEIVGEALDSNDPVLMHEINWAEVWYSIARKKSVKQADLTIDRLLSSGIKRVSFDWGVTKMAADFKRTGGISLADCLAAALAYTTNASLLTGDHEFEKVADKVTIIWLR